MVEELSIAFAVISVIVLFKVLISPCQKVNLAK